MRIHSAMLETDSPRAVPVRTPVGIFLILLLPLSLAATVFAAMPIREAARRERTSLQTSGEVVSTRVETMPCYGACKGGPGYRPRVLYRYAVDGRAYTSERVTSLDDVGSMRWASQVAERYVPRQQVVVRYSPTTPAQAYLEASPTRWLWLLATVPLALTCCLAGAMWRKNQRRQPRGAGPLAIGVGGI